MDVVVAVAAYGVHTHFSAFRSSLCRFLTYSLHNSTNKSLQIYRVARTYLSYCLVHSNLTPPGQTKINFRWQAVCLFHPAKNISDIFLPFTTLFRIDRPCKVARPFLSLLLSLISLAISKSRTRSN